jgi:hypothetical protein
LFGCWQIFEHVGTGTLVVLVVEGFAVVLVTGQV